jgi:hypothetical protein
MRRHIDAVEQCALPPDRAPGFDRTWRRAGPALGMCRVDRHDLAVDQPVEQVAQRGEPCLTEGAASSRVDASIHAATCTG